MVEMIQEFVVKEESRAQFELGYGPAGAWSRLFARHPGFRGTTLLRDTNDPRRYLAVDFWAGAQSVRWFAVGLNLAAKDDGEISGCYFARESVADDSRGREGEIGDNNYDEYDQRPAGMYWSSRAHVLYGGSHAGIVRALSAESSMGEPLCLPPR